MDFIYLGLIFTLVCVIAYIFKKLPDYHHDSAPQDYT